MKIVMVPLDERPCNYSYPSMMPAADYELLLPPMELMGRKKEPADFCALSRWLLENIVGADACILSLDTLLYGGIVPSRLHHHTEEELFRRAALVRELRRRNPAMKLYLFQLIMRCPNYSLSDEEPDYYADYGRELHLLGRYRHKKSLGILTEEEARELKEIEAKIPEDVLSDFLSRREKNLNVLLSDLEMIKDGTADFFIVPQDDAAVYGFTTMDQARVRGFLKANSLHLRTAMYPSADDTGLILLARAVAEKRGIRPKVFVHYASVRAELCVPWFEDRPLGETVKYHILSMGGIQVYSLAEADIILAVNMAPQMLHEDDPAYPMTYDVGRNLAEFTNFIAYALRAGKTVALADVAACNGSDRELLHLLDSEDLLLKLHAYAGWNTSSNTIGTCLCQAALVLFGGDEKGRISFLLHRYYEDMGYMGYVRKDVTDSFLPSRGLDYFHADGKRGEVAKRVAAGVEAYMGAEFPSLAAHVGRVDAEMPWERMFETKLTLKVKE